MLAKHSQSKAQTSNAADHAMKLKHVLSKESNSTEVPEGGFDSQQDYDKFACSCEEATKKLASEITTGRSELIVKGNTILQKKGGAATAANELYNYVEEMKQNEVTQKELTSVRQKENQAFVTEKVELEQALAALEKALIILKGATMPPATSPPPGESSELQKSVVAAVQASEGAARAARSLDARQLAALSQLSAALAAVKREGSHYAPQSLTIQGILQSMYDTFSTSLESQSHTEATAHRAYEENMSNYQSELSTLQQAVKDKEHLKAEDERQLADAEQEYKYLESGLEAKVASFEQTKQNCESRTQAWAAQKAALGAIQASSSLRGHH